MSLQDTEKNKEIAQIPIKVFELASVVGHALGVIEAAVSQRPGAYIDNQDEEFHTPTFNNN